MKVNYPSLYRKDPYLRDGTITTIFYCQVAESLFTSMIYQRLIYLYAYCKHHRNIIEMIELLISTIDYFF
jgi:hypothetical protein